MPTLDFLLTSNPIHSETPRWDEEFGAEVIFWGVVRGTEEGKPITGIDYTLYPSMAEKSPYTTENRICADIELDDEELDKGYYKSMSTRKYKDDAN